MKKIGFTLAEVLITLVIIGVIAAITVPTLMNHTQGQEYKTALKKGISTLNQALTLHYTFNGEGLRAAGDIDGDYKYVEYIYNAFKDNLSGVVEEDSFYWEATYLGGDTFEGALCLPDGICFNIDFMNWAVDENNAENSACNSSNTVPCARDFSTPNIYIDVNGQKGPNKMTISANHPKDQYQAMMYNQRVVPFGEATQQVMYDKKRTNAS